MADIHVLPSRPSGSNVEHLTELLTSAWAEGVDLGPRRHHMYALALTLENNLATLCEIAAELRQEPSSPSAAFGHD